MAGVAGLSRLHDDYLRECADHPGLLPIVELGEPVARRGAGGSVAYAPCFRIVDWAARPDGLTERQTLRTQ